jgi:hypothetical protein
MSSLDHTTEPIHIPLTKNKISLVSSRDSDLADLKWHYSVGYAFKRFCDGYKDKGKIIGMHVIILQRMLGRNLIKGECVDHVNMNTLDNQRSNLRLANKQKNSQNTKRRKDNASGYKGVAVNQNGKKWRAYITVNKKRIHLGEHDTPELAHKAYCEAAMKYFGEFARFE